MVDASPDRISPDVDPGPLRAHTMKHMSTPTIPTGAGQNRRPATPAAINGRSPDKTLQLIVRWEHALEKLKLVLDDISDWGPFELIHIEVISIENDHPLRADCWFEYHGAKSNRDHHEWNLKLLLKDFAVCEEPQRSSAPPALPSGPSLFRGRQEIYLSITNAARIPRGKRV
ncbi:MAG: hypothetical protein AAGC77_14845 [Pseudomonadota bacterium]